MSCYKKQVIFLVLVIVVVIVIVSTQTTKLQKHTHRDTIETIAAEPLVVQTVFLPPFYSTVVSVQVSDMVLVVTRSVGSGRQANLPSELAIQSTKARRTGGDLRKSAH